MSIISERIKIALKIRGIRASALSYKTGISEASLSHYIAGHYDPKMPKIKKIASALKVSEGWLSGYDVPMENYPPPLSNVANIPVLGYCAAGLPIEAIQDILDYEEVSPELLKDGYEYFALKLKGDSMEPRMKNGDVVIIRKQDDINSGEIGVVCVNGDESTVKRIMKQADGILLVPLNPAFTPIFYSNHQIVELPVTILGKVVELRAKF